MQLIISQFVTYVKRKENFKLDIEGSAKILSSLKMDLHDWFVDKKQYSSHILI